MISKRYGHQLAENDPVLRILDIQAAQPDTRYLLCRNARGRLELQDAQKPQQTSLMIDWHGAELRRRIQAGRNQPLARACGLHKMKTPRLLDVTAGLGRDAWCLSQLGAQVTMLERHPVLQALLYDALAACSQPGPRPSLQFQDSLHANWPDADVVFLDPMFPGQGKRAAPGLDMQYLQGLLDADADAYALWEKAVASGVHRVVLKRPPRGAKVQWGKPAASFGGGRAVYDVYFSP